MDNECIMPTHIVAVGGIVENDRGQVLMVKHNHAGWVFPGGQVEVGENIIDALRREVLEETSINIIVGEVFCISSNTGKHPGYNGVKEIPTKVVLDFVCREVGGEIRASEENSETKWLTKVEAEKLITTPAYIERFIAYLEYSGRPTYLEYVTRPEFEQRLKITV